MAARESAIRDALAKALDILEPGLTVIQIEYPVPNAVGTKGFIDILAQDSMGNRVIIEVKRSNQAAREAGAEKVARDGHSLTVTTIPHSRRVPARAQKQAPRRRRGHNLLHICLLRLRSAKPRLFAFLRSEHRFQYKDQRFATAYVARRGDFSYRLSNCRWASWLSL